MTKMMKRSIRSYVNRSRTYVGYILAIGMILIQNASAQTAPVTIDRFLDPINAKVVRIIDGDTLGVFTNDTNENITIRIYGIDAPEKKQVYGTESKKSLSDMLFNKQVVITPISKDLYGRTVARVFVENMDVGLAMVCTGNAWWYCQYAKRDRQLAQCQKTAKQQRVGVWSQENPIAPWEFRKHKKQ